MPVTFDNAGSTATTGTALALTLTLTSGASLIVFGANDNGRSLSAVTYAGTALTRKALVQNGEVDCWVLTAPAAGANILSAQLVGAGISFAITGLSYVGLKDTGTFGTANSGTVGVVAAITLSISSTTTDLVVVGYKINGSQTLSIPSGTIRTSISSGAAVKLVVADFAGAATVSASASATSGTPSWAAIGLPLVFSAAAATANRYFRALRGVGT